uniref:Uncharacterized protein n=1 Tax=Arundo donax TaxID=35708 RepID=A0A0A8YAE7_ARUDO
MGHKMVSIIYLYLIIRGNLVQTPI